MMDEKTDERIKALEKQIKDLEWSAEYHFKKLKEAELMLDMHRLMLTTIKKEEEEKVIREERKK